MTFRIVVRRLAELDMIEVEDWYETQREGLGAEFREALIAIFGRLSRMPRICPIVHGDVRRAVLRRFPYVVYFMIDEARVVVLACLASQRDPRLHHQRSRR